MRTAFLIDGGFFLRRYHQLRGSRTPQEAAKALHWMCRAHLKAEKRIDCLYRIFYYDCPPLTKKAHNPVTKRAVDFSRSQMAVWRNQFHQELKKLRKLALRMGYLNERSGGWILRPELLKDLIAGRITSTS
jgi:hypothetical protein